MKRTLFIVAAAFALSLSACASNKTTAIEPDIAMDPVATDRANTYAYAVRGMACENCAGHLKEVIEQVPGVQGADVDFASSRAWVRVDPANPASSDSIREAGTKYMYEHMGLEYDPDCLDPENRERIRKGG
ncbi:MAG: heavy-metal-associated domain-containing protein [Phycisphaeraceae bacterium]|nr:heavy-metal-associated domain-containing protein [Phycisphaeraceae bacterium]